MKFSLLALLLAPCSALAVAALGCSVSAPFSASPNQSTVIHYGSDAGGGVDAEPGLGEEAGDAAAVPGNPLCRPSPGGCDPDIATPAYLCGKAPDGGPWDPTADYGDAGLACRVSPASSVTANGLGAGTACSVASAGMDGARCSYSSDCASGFDCVGSPAACRHYCCGGTCDGDQFCDIQSLAVATTTKVPVCMPIMPKGGCTLLKPGSCPTGETCAVVREDGATGCVQTGNAGPGDPCDTDHCGIDQVCLGSASAPANSPGRRICYALCSISSSSCASPNTCQGGLPLFQDPTVGVCR